MDGIGGKKGWEWIFIIEGLLTVIVAVFSFWMVHDFPDTARFLTPEERRATQIIAFHSYCLLTGSTYFRSFHCQTLAIRPAIQCRWRDLPDEIRVAESNRPKDVDSKCVWEVSYHFTFLIFIL